MSKKFRQVRPEDFDVEMLMAAAREGKLFVEISEKSVRREDLADSVKQYVSRAKVWWPNMKFNFWVKGIVFTHLENDLILQKNSNRFIMNKTSIQTVKNPYGHEVRQWCGSCKHRLIEDDGSRICDLMQIKVKRDFVCSHWLMNDAVRVAGLQNHGVVRLRGSKEIIIK